MKLELGLRDTTQLSLKQLFLQLIDIATADPNTDAIACKLKIILVVNGTPMYELLERTAMWDAKLLLKQYLTRLGHVSGTCRLTQDEELLLLEIAQHDFSGFASAILINRLQFLTVLKQLSPEDQSEFSNSTSNGSRLNEPFNVAAMNPEPLDGVFNFDGVIDDTVVTAADGALKKMNVISYTRP